MTVESDIFTVLKTLVANRVYPDVAPEGCALPYIVFHQIGGQAFYYIENTTPDTQNGRFQVNVWGATRSAVSALSLQVTDALSSSTVFQCRPTGSPMWVYEEEMKIYGAMIDFSIWSAR